jgi:hypothetical protein
VCSSNSGLKEKKKILWKKLRKIAILAKISHLLNKHFSFLHGSGFGVAAIFLAWDFYFRSFFLFLLRSRMCLKWESLTVITMRGCRSVGLLGRGEGFMVENTS